jgi:hypothetical protein
VLCNRVRRRESEEFGVQSEAVTDAVVVVVVVVLAASMLQT